VSEATNYAHQRTLFKAILHHIFIGVNIQNICMRVCVCATASRLVTVLYIFVTFLFQFYYISSSILPFGCFICQAYYFLWHICLNKKVNSGKAKQEFCFEQNPVTIYLYFNANTI